MTDEVVLWYTFSCHTFTIPGAMPQATATPSGRSNLAGQVPWGAMYRQFLVKIEWDVAILWQLKGVNGRTMLSYIQDTHCLVVENSLNQA